MSVDNIKDAKNKSSAFFSMNSYHAWFPVFFLDATGCKNLMINLYVPVVHNDNFILEIDKKGMKLYVGTKRPPPWFP
jgi:hypothetical protein